MQQIIAFAKTAILTAGPAQLSDALAGMEQVFRGVIRGSAFGRPAHQLGPPATNTTCKLAMCVFGGWVGPDVRLAPWLIPQALKNYTDMHSLFVQARAPIGVHRPPAHPRGAHHRGHSLDRRCLRDLRRTYRGQARHLPHTQ